MEQHFNRAEDDLGNIVGLEHVNVLIPDQQIATLFYVVGLGLTRDPYLMTSVTNMWVNLGRSQFHLPTGKPQELRGVVGIVVPDPLDGIVKFYRRMLDVPARIAKDAEGGHALVGVGDGQDLLFRETDREPALYDGHHIAIYVADFS